MADNTTRLKILAQVEGVQGFDSLKRSLQGLAQQGQGTQRDLFRLVDAYKQLKSGGENTISGMRQQVAVLTQLRESVSTTGILYKRWGAELDQVQGKLRALTQAERGAAQARPAAAVGGGMGLAGLAGQYAPQLAVGAAVAGIATAGVSAESAQVRLKALTDQFGEYNEAQAAAARIAGTLRLSTAESQQSFANLYASLRPTGITVKELEDTLIGFSAAARNSGATAQETSNALIQLKQGLASGTLQGEELRSIREQAPLAAQAIAKEMGTTIGNLKNLAAEGKVTTDVVIRAMGRLKEEQLGKLNAQFNTAEQAMIDMKNAAVDLGAELSKIGGPVVVGAIRVLIDAIKGATTAVERFGAGLENFKKLQPAISPIVSQFKGLNDMAKTSGFSNWVDSVSKRIATNMIPGLSQVLSIVSLINKQTGGVDLSTSAEKLTKAGIPEAKRTYSVPGVGTFDMITGRMVTSLTQENLADQAKARSETERRNNAAGQAGAGKDKIVVLGGVTGGDQPGPSRGRSTGAHLHAQFGPGITEAQAIQLVYKAIDFGAQTPQVGGRRFAGHGYPGLDFPMAASRFTLKPGYSGTDLGIQGTLGRGMRISGPGGSFEIGHLRDVTTGKESQRLDEQQKALNESYDAAQRLAQEQQKLAEQRAKEQKDTIDRNRKLTEQAQQQEGSYFASLQATKDQARLLGVMTEGQRLLEEFANNILDIERDTAKAKAEALTEDAAALAVADGELKKKNALNKLYQDQAALEQARNAELMDFSTTNSIMQSSISGELQKQADAMERQRNMAEGIASTIGQGFSQAFDLAIQGSEDWKRSLSEIASGVLRDIAKQLIEIAVINTITKAVTGMISPAPKPAQNVPGYGSAGFLGIGTLPQGSNMPLDSTFSSPDFPAGFVPEFATGGIMTPQGAVPLRRYARGGIATAPQAAIYGEGATPEAFVPLPDGRRIPVALRQYPGIPGAPGTGGSFEQTDAVVQRLVETARQESAVRAATVSAAGPDGTMRIQIETTRINSVDYVTAEQAQALAQAAATRSTARQQRALQGSPAARRSVGI